jgi:hypothetical protein
MQENFNCDQGEALQLLLLSLRSDSLKSLLSALLSEFVFTPDFHRSADSGARTWEQVVAQRFDGFIIVDRDAGASPFYWENKGLN